MLLSAAFLLQNVARPQLTNTQFLSMFGFKLKQKSKLCVHSLSPLATDLPVISAGKAPIQFPELLPKLVLDH